MAFVITPIDTGSVDVNGIPYRRDYTFAQFEKDSSGVPTGRMSLTAYYAGMPVYIFPFTPYGELVNGETSDFFGSLTELTDFVAININVGNNTLTNTIALAFKIVAGSPANPNQKTAGSTITDTRMIGASYSAISMLINNDTYDPSEISYNNATGVIGLNPTNANAFKDGDIAVVQIAKV